MEPESAQGSVLLCNPSSSLINSMYCCSSSSGTCDARPLPDGEPGSRNKPKKKRSRPKSKNAIKELALDNLSMPEEKLDETPCETVLVETEETIDLMKNLQMASLDEQQKPKRVRKKKKASKDKKCEIVHAKDLFSTEDELKEDIKGEQETSKQSNDNIERSPKRREAFFSDNRKGAVRKKTNASAKKKTEKLSFEDYLSADDVELGLRNKSMVAGSIRINPRCYKEAYISSEGEEKDIMIEGLKDRNRALEGDEVIVLINPPDAWKVWQTNFIFEIAYCY